MGNHKACNICLRGILQEEEEKEAEKIFEATD